MPSDSFNSHLEQLLLDAEELKDAHAELRTGNPGRQYRLASLNRAIVITAVSAWESYVEQLVRESVVALRPTGPPFADPWPALNAYVTGRLGRFNTPNQHNVEELIRSCLGLSDVHDTWVWQNCTSAQAVQRLDGAMDFRHRIAHGVNPRPTVHNFYSSRLPEFFRRLAQCTDEAVRSHLVGVHGLANPWPV